MVSKYHFPLKGAISLERNVSFCGWIGKGQVDVGTFDRQTKRMLKTGEWISRQWRNQM